VPKACDRSRGGQYCLASVTIHDLSPTAGYLAGHHIRLRYSLGLLTRPLADELPLTGPSAVRGWTPHRCGR